MSLAPPNMPRTDSFNARVRGTSHIDFKTATTGVAAKSMRNEISRIVSTVDDPVAKKVRSPNPPRSLRYLIASQAFDTEMQSFFYLFTRYLTERAQSVDLYVLILSIATHPTHNHPVTGIVSNHPLKIRSSLMLIFQNQSIPRTSTSWPYSKSTVVSVPQWVCSYNRPPSFPDPSHCTLGMTGAKSALEVKDDMTFLDLTVRQIEHLNTTSRVDVPLILMTSFNTHDDTLRIIKKYANQQLRITTFNQSRYPRIYKETLLPCPKRVDDDKKNWYPPGHGDLYNALLHSGVLDQLLSEGKEYLFVSNSDNLGAVYVNLYPHFILSILISL